MTTVSAGHALGPLGETAAGDDDLGLRVFTNMPYHAGVVGILDFDPDAQFAGNLRRGIEMLCIGLSSRITVRRRPRRVKERDDARFVSIVQISCVSTETDVDGGL